MLRTLHKDKLNNDITWALVSFCERKNLPVDRVRLSQQFPALHDFTGFQIAACALGLAIRLKRVAAMELYQLPLPIVAFEKAAPNMTEQSISNGARQVHSESENVASSTNNSPANLSPCLIIRADKERI